MSNYRIGDTVFRGRIGGVISGRNQQDGTITVDTADGRVSQIQQFGYINGLSETDRKRFQEIILDVKSLKDSKERIMKLQQTVDELNQDPKNHILIKYLKSEMAHIMYADGIFPKTYNTEEWQIS